MANQKRFDKILEDIRSIKIQGARSIARAALYAYSLNPTKEGKQKLISARVTEPMLVNSLHNSEHLGYKKTLQHFDSAQEAINKNVSKLIKNNSIIFLHCHSTNVIQALIYAKKQKRTFQVYNTETRPLFQGRQTSRELSRAGVKVTEFVDSAIDEILGGKQGIKKPSLILLGADAILEDGVINKVGSGMIAELARLHKVPVYIIADSWKYSSHHIKLEERDYHEVWQRVPRKIKIRNPAFEKVDRKYIESIVSELGSLSYSQFLRKVKK